MTTTVGDNSTSHWVTTTDGDTHITGSMTPWSNNTWMNTAMTSMTGWTWAPIKWEWWTSLQVMLAIIGIIGNGVVLLVVFRPRRKRRSTDTLIGALAVADFLTSIFIIPHRNYVTLPDDTVAAELYCRIIDSSVFMWISICASIFTLTSISVERLLAVRYPFKFQRVFTPKGTALVIICLWIFSAVLNTYSLYLHSAADGGCQFTPTAEYQKFLGVALFVAEYLVPVVVMITAHVLTIRALNMQSRAHPMAGGRQRKDLKLLQARRRVMQMVLVVVITFIVCWTPDQFGFLAFNLGFVDFSHLFSPLYRIFVVLAFVNSCANPFIYALGNNNFRREFARLFYFWKSKAPREGYQSVFADGAESSKTSDMKTNVSDIQV